MRKILVLILAIFFVNSCVKVPEWVTPVKNFKVKRYMGKWYEIARLDHNFEIGLNSVSADYTLRPDGGITISNNGYMVRREEWRYAEGRASFVDDENVGLLKVSFMRPFYGAYVIFKLDPDYEYAYVCGEDRSFLWLLSRTEYVDQDIIDDFETEARKLGFDTSQLIYVQHM
ncbi:MAG: lipocalin [Candidatus Marinimicrobia bacterium]|mgnify:CR=1|jgi:apolipoprotein D and lipocalin family protein|nr:lipocalin [Candidatus Neomarinimicrobiota bacterium]MBT4360335.1 lipocalin [Candidatus Neomarinimicrobiota bacterium]MBT4714552.1 lipocalin [Candidatus Neomarinimicrobiota bacterium]MBT4946591.1 lipocalin [Candidatus Neomarinimicrobiota bacterium]MBT5270330.1 lipocalin [Candidatus Neomarinimicrobiota bacterium]